MCLILLKKEHCLHINRFFSIRVKAKIITQYSIFIYLFKFEVVYRIRLCSVVKKKNKPGKRYAVETVSVLCFSICCLVSVCLHKSALRLSDVTGCVSPTTTLLLLPSSQPCILQFCEWVTSHCHHCCSVHLGVSFPCRGGWKRRVGGLRDSDGWRKSVGLVVGSVTDWRNKKKVTSPFTPGRF